MTGKKEVGKIALLARINRKIIHDRIALRRPRGIREQQSLGDYYLLDLDRNLITRSISDLGGYAREIGVLFEHETYQEK